MSLYSFNPTQEKDDMGLQYLEKTVYACLQLVLRIIA